MYEPWTAEELERFFHSMTTEQKLKAIRAVEKFPTTRLAV
jgi:hypothetical protein